MPGISVIIPCYNSQKTLRETLESVLAQTLQDIEIIVVDDGSTDQTRHIAASFGERVRYLYQTNRGQAAARNAGIREATGEWIAFLDSDDLWLPEKLERQFQIVHDKKVDWCYCDCLSFREVDHKILGRHSRLVYPAREGWILKPLLMGNCIASPTPFIRRTVFDQVGGFDESSCFRIGEDWELWLRIAAQYPVAYLAEALAKHREHAESVSHQVDPLQAFASHQAVIEKITHLFPQELNGLKKTAIAYYAARFSKSCWLQGNLPGAKRLIDQARTLQPGKLSYLGYAMIYHLPIWLTRFALALRKRWMPQ